jgi:LPXTG-motif cell wall-anchored protein
MIVKLHRGIAISLVAAILCLGVGQMVQAAPYGTSDYGTCTYQGDCSGSATTTPPPAASSGSTSNTVNSSGAPNTGLQRESRWFIVAGIIGLSLISFVGIRYLNTLKSKK